MFRVQNLNAQHLLHLSFSIAGDLVTAAQSAVCAWLCVCVCVPGESSELLKSLEPRGENLLVGIFENAFKWMKLFTPPPLLPLHTPLSLACKLAPAVWPPLGGVSLVAN